MNKQRLFESVLNETIDKAILRKFIEYCQHGKCAIMAWPSRAPGFLAKHPEIKIDPDRLAEQAQKHWRERRDKINNPDFQHYWKWCKMDCDPRMLDVDYALDKWENQ